MKHKTLDELLEDVLSLLSKAGFTVEAITYPEDKRSVDIVGRAQDKKIILKVTHDSSRLSRRELEDLKKMSSTYRASALIVAEKYRRNNIEDDVVYVRNKVYVVNKNLLENYFLKKDKPIIINVRGSYLLRINSNKFIKKRLELGLSRSEVANRLQVTRELIYQYETRRSMTSIQTALRIARLMGEDVFEEIDLMKESVFNEQEHTVEDRVLKEIKEFLGTSEVRYYEFKTAPIDGAIVKEDKTVSIINLEGIDRDESDSKTENAIKISNMTRSIPVFIRGKNDIVRVKDIIMEIMRE
ncbi:helix-turn-helix domain-containing protein [Thermogladius sp. 4427co]|uniref:helix-turn-helix domain-containing protein n=1 Tax=Thermogladius sp. 4427co TaxID=3450718 RepID=UPI003F79ADA0